MAAPIKRKHDSNNDTNSVTKKASLDVDADSKLRDFISWCQENNFQISPKVTVKRDGSCAQYGMHAVEDIAEGYCLFQVPRSMLLMPENTNIANAVENEKSQLTATNQWIPLLLTLLHESSKDDSKWAPYLAIAPDPDAIDLPMFWDKTEISRFLSGTGVDEAVKRDLQMIEEDFNKLVLPFTQRNEGKISDNVLNLDNFKKMVAFVMAYSFTEPEGKAKKSGDTGSEQGDSEEDEEEEDEDNEGEERMLPPVMVPLADTLNHITNHNAKLTFGREAFKMVTTREIKKGEEIYNTYGQVSNLHLMHMYGFAEQYPENTNDVVEVPASRLLEAAKEKCDEDEKELKLIQSKWDMLIEQDIIAEDEMFVLGQDGILNDDIFLQVVKVLCMSQAEYKQYVENEGWSDDGGNGSDAEESTLDIEKCSQLSCSQKELLKKMCERHVENYAVSFASAEEKLKSASSLPPRERYALYTSHGQQMLIQQFVKACSSSCC